MKVTRIEAGIYRVEINNHVVMLCGGKNYNPDSEFFRNGGWEIWNASSKEECRDDNCWACGAYSKKIALKWIEETFKNTTT